jgi:hypothetical protein
MPREKRGDRDWVRYERDWRGYERYRRNEVDLFLRKARSLVESNPAPWTPQRRGQPPYPAKAMVTLLLLKTWLGMDYRSISAYLRAFPEQRIRVGLEKTPSHATIRNHMLRLPEAYLPRLNTQLTKPYQKGDWPQIAQASASSATRHG